MMSGNDLQLAAERAEQTARRWASLSTKYPSSPAERLLASVLEDPDGLGFTVGFVDGVIRPEDLKVAADNLRQLTRRSPNFLPGWLRIPARMGGAVGPLAPSAVVPAARKVFSQLVGDLVLDVGDKKLGPAIAKLRANGSRLNINLLGEAVLGDDEAGRRLASVFDLLRRDDVDYVSLKVSSVVGPHNPWDHEAVVDRAIERLLPLYRYAADSETPKFLNLDMEEYRDMDLTMDVFQRILDRPEMQGLEAGIVIQAYLPDALSCIQRLGAWASERVARGGARIKVRLVKGANLAMEAVEAEIHGWPLVTWESRQATDANYVRILDWALRPENTAAMRIGVAGHNLFTLAAAWELADLRGVRDSIDIEMLAGMAAAQAQAVREEVGSLLLYVPVVHPDEFDVAIAYLVRRLEENSAPENFMSSVFDIGEDSKVFEKERDRFRRAIKQAIGEGTKRCHPSRMQNRQTETAQTLEAQLRAPGGGWRFAGAPDSDPSLAANREWMQQIASRVPTSSLGRDTVAANTDSDVAGRIERAVRAGEAWRSLPVSERAEALHRLGIEMARRRGDMLEVAAAELGKGVDQTDPEISEAIDFAHYYAIEALELDRISGARFVPAGLTVVTPPWNFPLSIPIGGVAGALAAGNPVILKPATPARRCGAVLAECLWAAGIDPDLAQLFIPADRAAGRALIEDPRVQRVVLTGSSETAQMFQEWRPDLTLLAETSGKNSIIVTPSADLDLAARDVVSSAFGHAGQKCSAASLVILVGSAGRSKRFRTQLLDATRSLRVGWGDDLSAQMGPLSEVPGEKLLRGLTALEIGQSWAVQPTRQDDTDRLWTPGIRSGVEAGSEFHQVEYFGPVLGVIRVDTLEEAVEVQNGVEFGLTAGIQSLSRDEVQYWLDHVQAGNIYINRGITGAIVRRQPFGGWKLSAVGPGAKAGGPNYLFGFGSFEPADEPTGEVGGEGYPAVPERDLHLRKPQLLELVEVARQILDPAAARRVERAAYNAEHACETEFDQLNDPSGLRYEKNVLRYLPTRSVLRAELGVPLDDLLCVAAAAAAVGEFREEGRFTAGQRHAVECGILLSTAEDLPPAVYHWAERYGFGCITESASEFEAHLQSADLNHDGRVRLLGRGRDALVHGGIDIAVWDGPATTAGRVEILPFVHEQAVSLTTHRFGTLSDLGRSVL